MSASAENGQFRDLNKEPLEFHMEFYDEVDSTNERVKDALRAGAAEGLAVLARRQTGGYGRQGRSWASPEGGLYMSLLLRPDVPLAELPTLSLVVGLAAREAIAGSVASDQADSIKVKWPNDVVHAGDDERVDKLCGISLERVANGVCIGIGVNVFPADDAALEGKNERWCLTDLGMSATATLDDVRDAVLAEFAERYVLWSAKGFFPFREEYAACALLTGKEVVIEDHSGAPLVRGCACGVDDEGCLLVHAADGVTHRVSSGEAHIISIGSLAQKEFHQSGGAAFGGFPAAASTGTVAESDRSREERFERPASAHPAAIF